MCLLLLFNQHQELTYLQICQLVPIHTTELQTHLIPLVKQKLLLKSPATHSLSNEDRFTVNMDFKSPLLRNKIPVLVSRAVKETDSNKLQSKVEDDRRFAIDAAIMKVMKSKRRVEYQMLIMETTKLLLQRFKPDPAQVKLRIEHLIERFFIERDEEDKRIFKYIA